MNRPFLLQYAPVNLRTFLYYHLFRDRVNRFSPLFDAASLHYAPQITMQLLPTDEAHSNIALTGFYELDLTKRLVQHAMQGRLLVDIGANYGYYSLLWAAARPENRVFAFEPAPRNYDGMKANIARNGMQKQIELHALAVGADRGKLQFALGPEEQTGWGGLSLAASENTIEVDVIRMDEFWQRDEPIDVLKIDVEGADTWVLKGAQKLLESRSVRHIYYEQNKNRMRELQIAEQEAAEFLEAAGYSVEPISDPKGGLVEYCARPALV